MKKHDWIDVLFWFCVTVIAFAFGCSITSCSVLHKSKSIAKVDSVSVVKEYTVSSVSTDSSVLRKSQTGFQKIVDTTKTIEESTVVETTVVKEFDTSGKLLKKTTTRKKAETKKATGAAVSIVDITSNVVDSTGFLEHAGLVKDVIDSNNVKKETKNKTVVRKSLPWYMWLGGSLLLLLLIAYIIYRYRQKIKDFVIYKATGL